MNIYLMPLNLYRIVFFPFEFRRITQKFYRFFIIMNVTVILINNSFLPSSHITDTSIQMNKLGLILAGILARAPRPFGPQSEE